MNKTDKQLRYFVKSLMKYAEEEGHINPGFTTEQIPTIFKGWDELQFNKIYHGIGAGCCIYIGPDRYSINKAHCFSLKNKFTDSDRTKLKLIIAAIGLVIMLVGVTITILNYRNNNNQNPPDKQEKSNNLNWYKHKEPPKK